MSRKDYRAIAEALKELPGLRPTSPLIKALLSSFSRDNPSFNQEKFLETAGLGEKR